MRPIQVCLVDDQDDIYHNVTRLLDTADDIYLAAWAHNGEEAIDLCTRHTFDLVLMDVMMPIMDGVEATQHLCQQFPDLKILVLSSVHDHESVHSMMKNGALGYVTKDTLATDLLNTVRATYNGQSVFSAAVTQELLTPKAPPENTYDLTERELEVLELMAQGHTNRQIGYDLSISQSTVKFHVANVIEKMGVDTRSEALVAATRARLV